MFVQGTLNEKLEWIIIKRLSALGQARLQEMLPDRKKWMRQRLRRQDLLENLHSRNSYAMSLSCQGASSDILVEYKPFS